MKPSDLTEQSFIHILLDPAQRRTLLTTLSTEHGNDLSLSNLCADLAFCCKATPEQLRQAITDLRTEHQTHNDSV
jgi:hypothetical protein